MEDFSVTREERLSTLLQENRERLVALLERVFFLKKVEMFRHVDSEKLVLLAEIAQEVKMPKGQVLVREREVGETMYVVVKGRLQLRQTRDGQDYVVEELNPGDVFGDLGVFGNKHVPAAYLRGSIK